MPDYKRKKVKKTIFHKKTHNLNNDIESNTKNSKKRNNSVDNNDKIKVVRGSKFRRKRISKALILFVLVISLTLVVFSVCLPGGLYENVVNFTARMGSGNYPNEISGSVVIDNVSSASYYYVLTDTSVIAYSNNGKMILNDSHGFSNPIISISDTRALVFDQGGKKANIYNLKGKIHTYESEYEIINASISSDGTVAFATHSDKYTSVLKIYDKNLNHIYTWNSAKDIISNVILNKKGNRVAVSTLNVVSGQYDSKMHILNFDSADPVYSMDLNNSLVLSLENTGRGISVICADKYKHVNWTKFTTTDTIISGEINSYSNTSGGLLLVLNRPNNRADNTIVLISKSGKKENEFKINSHITDIQYSKSRVYYISDGKVEILDKEGNVLRKNSCIYGTEKITVLSPNSIATICDRKIYKIDIQKGEG